MSAGRRPTEEVWERRAEKEPPGLPLLAALAGESAAVEVT